MESESVRHLNSNENDALYWVLKFAEKNPSTIGLDEEELKGVRELFKSFKSGRFRLSENTSIIK